MLIFFDNQMSYAVHLGYFFPVFNISYITDREGAVNFQNEYLYSIWKQLTNNYLLHKLFYFQRLYLQRFRNSLKKRGLTPRNVGDRKVCVVVKYLYYICYRKYRQMSSSTIPRGMFALFIESLVLVYY
jgi:hypothetical protein